MSEKKWTSGPWHVDFDDDVGVFVASEDPTLDIVCLCREYNANLIAAAPELYEALSSAVEREEYMADMEGRSEETWMGAARAALAKARGES